MRRRPQISRRDRELKPGALRLLRYVEEPEAHLESAVGQGRDAAHDRRLGAARAVERPLRRGDIDAAREPVRREQADQATAAQVRGNDVRNPARFAFCAGERGHDHGDLLCADAHDVDRELRPRRQHGHECQQGKREQ